MKNYLKRTTTFILALLMLLSVPLQAFAEVNYDNLAGDKTKIINELTPVKPAKPDEGKTAADLIKNPDQPAIYTLRTDYKVQRGERYEVDYQPYIASVGAAATEDEQKKVDQTIKLPELAGYDKPEGQEDFKIDYKTVKDAADGKNKTGNATNGLRYSDKQEFYYKAKSNNIQIKHVFQDLHDFAKYTNPNGSVGDDGSLITTQQGNTGSTMEVSPLTEGHPNRKGFVPERKSITMQVPENAENFILEYRYNRAHYDVVFDTQGGTPLPNRTLYYEQVIPNIADADIPTKVGGIFQGWKPSITLETTDGKTYPKDEIIKYPSGNSINNLPANLKMPASNVTFTAVWKDKDKADYAIQFWAEKADHDDNASLLEKYDYMGAHVFKNENTGTRPNLDTVSIDKIPFPDLDQKRLEKIWAGERFNRGKDLYLNKFYVYNKKLTDDQNKDPKNVNLVKSVEATGKTVYNIYYDRQVYDLYFTQSNWFENEEFEGVKGAQTFYPEIYKPDGKAGAKLVGGPGNLYHYKARFNQLMLDWPNDSMQTKGFTEGWQSYGWGPNYSVPAWPVHLDTPPYRLNADEFLDMDYTGGGNDGVSYEKNGGYTKRIDKGDGTSINLDPTDFTTLSFGIKQGKNSIPHHMDFWMDGFKPDETIIRYDLYRSKADTDSSTYEHRYSKVQGFTAKQASKRTTLLTEDDIFEKNDERAEITPFPDKKYKDTFGYEHTVGEIIFMRAFFNNADGYGDPLDGNEFKTNGYLKFDYTRNKYPLRFNFDPSKIKGDSEFGPTNQLDTFYQFPLKALSPDLVDNNTPQADREYFKDKPANLLDNPENLQKLGLTDLVFNDPNDENKLKVRRPDGLSDQMVFKGWALDPAGTKLVWENSSEKMPNHAVNLYAKWGEPDFKWKVTFDPNGGTLRSIDETKVTQKRKTIQEGDIGQEKTNTYAKKEENEGEKQVFTVIQRQKLVEPNFKPTRKGYDFMGWEIIHYKKNQKGDYTDEIDNSYRETYKVPELYSFGNDVVAPVYLKAIWVPNERVDVKIEHYFLDKEYNLDKKVIPNPEPDKLVEKRAGYLVATTGDRQNDKYILAPHDELEKKLPDDLKAIYEEYNNRVGLNNTFFQTFRVEPEKIDDGNGNLIDNPKAENNVFKFFYRPFRQREYKVNYIDERGKKEVEDFLKNLELTDIDKMLKDPDFSSLTKEEQDAKILEANQANKEKFEAKKTELDKILKKYQIVEPEAVTNGNRHYDARNYRRIPGWTLTSDPQQQLFFDVDEKTNDFLGINGTGGDQIFFYYKDVRVIEVPTPPEGQEIPEPPEGYVRVTFKADKGGSFTDKDGKEVTELHYDVIKGLKSDLLPEPKELGTKADGTPNDKEEGKYYITPETGKKFIKWDKPLLNKNTIINEAHEFTAYFEWSGLTASGLVRTEAFKDPNGKWNNDFAPTIEQLKAQLEWKEKDEVKPLPKGATIEFFYTDENGVEQELTTNDQVYDLVKEMGKADTDELVRTVNIKAKVTFTDGKEPQKLDIPVTVYKNVYEALNKAGDKPLFLKEAEKKDAKDGGLKDILKDNTENRYIKVTIKPNKNFDNKDDKVYYVNPNAWVEIPGVKTNGDSNFTNWTADIVEQNDDGKENGKFDFAKRHKFTKDTIITPVGAGNVVEQTDPNKKPPVPDSYVKVIVDKTTKAELGTEEKQTQTFWVNPTKEVSIPVANPTGKTDQEIDIPKLGKKKVNYVFNKWQKVKAGEADDNLVEVKPAEKIELSSHKYTDKVTVIEAFYFEKFAATPIVKPIKTEELHTPEGKEITDEDLIKQITPPENKEIESITVVERPDPSNPGKQEAKVTIKYKDGSTQGTNDNPLVIPVEVHENIIPAGPSGEKPEKALENYVKVIFKAGEGGSLSGDLVYYVSPEVEVDMTELAGKITKTPKTGYISGDWDTSETKKLKDTFKTDTEFTFNFIKSEDIVEKTDENPNKPDGYVTITFKTDGNGTVNGKDVIIYYVNPDAGIRLGKSAGEKTLVVPTPTANANYVFNGWQEAIDETTPITNDRTHVAIFQSGQVTLTYKKGGEDVTGELPANVSVNVGEIVVLAGKGTLAKPNASFAGWKLDEDEKTYQPGDQVKLEKARTATAQWTTDKHKVEFDTDGGSKAPDTQFVEHNGHAKKPATDPTKENFVFLGWKENANDENYFDFENKPIDKDLVLYAQWTKAVEKINDGDPVEAEFIKVTFKEGDHGKLKLADTEQTSPVTYKVAKGISFAEAKAAGLEVPEIAPAKYYKVKQDQEGEAPKYGWDKELKLEGAEIEFIAQYEPIADVIPVDPILTPDENLQNDKPEDMVLVEFKVPEDKAYMLGYTKFYVKKGAPVEITPPLVVKTDENYDFKGWSIDEVTKKFIGTFEEDTTINSDKTEAPDIKIQAPSAGVSFVKIIKLTDGATGHLVLTRNGQEYEFTSTTMILKTRVRRKIVEEQITCFDLSTQSLKLQANDKISIYATKDNLKSDTREYTIR